MFTGVLGNPQAQLGQFKLAEVQAAEDTGASASIICASSIMAHAEVLHEAHTTLSSISTLTAHAEVEHEAHLDISCVSAIVAAGTIHKFGVATLSSISTLTAHAEVEHEAHISIAAVSTLTAHASVEHEAHTSLSSISTLTAHAEVEHEAHISIAAVSALTSHAEVEHEAHVSLDCESALVAEGDVAGDDAIASIICSSTLSAHASVVHSAHTSIFSSSTLSAHASVVHNSSTTLLCSSTLTATVAEVLAYEMSGGLTLASNIFDPTGVSVTYYSNLECEWHILSKIERDLQFKWDVGEQGLRYYQIEGVCQRPPTCEVTGVEPNDENCASGGSRLFQIIAARDLADLCEKLQERFLTYPVKWPISKIKRYSRPVYTDVIDFEEANGVDHDCNVSEEQEFCFIPECLNFCLESLDEDNDVASIGATAFIQDAFYVYESSGGFVLDGLTIPVVDQGTIASGGFTLGGVSGLTSTYFSFIPQGGLVLDGVVSTTSSAWDYIAEGDIVVSGMPFVSSSNYDYVFSDGLLAGGSGSAMFTAKFNPVFPLITISGNSGLQYNINLVGLGGVVLGGSTATASSYYSYVGVGGLSLSGVSGLISSNWNLTGSGGLALNGSYRLGMSSVPSGGMILAGEAESSYVMFGPSVGGITLSGSAEIAESSGWSYIFDGDLEFGGEVETSIVSMGTINSEAEPTADLLLLEPVFAVFDEADSLISDVEDISVNCDCKPLPANLLMVNNLNSVSILKDFIVRNSLSLPTESNLVYNKFDKIWRCNFHFRGSGAENGIPEDWTVLVEWGCVDELGSTELDAPSWKFSLFVVRNRRTINKRTETRVLYTFQKNSVCLNNDFSFSFTLNTQTGDITSNDELVVQDVILKDDIGIFDGKNWNRDPNLDINILAFENFSSIPTVNIKPIFPETLSV